MVHNIPDQPFEAVIQEPLALAAPKTEISSRATQSADASLKDLISRSQAGDTLAMERIYHRLKTPLFNLAYRYASNRVEAEDLLQDIFLKVFDHIGDVQKADTFIAWVYRIALNTCYSYLRARTPVLRSTVSINEVESSVLGVSQALSVPDARKPLEMAIQTLPHKLRRVFLLHDVQGFTHQEIARMLGLSVGTSKSQLFKARQRLRERLKTHQMMSGDMP